jgi:TfoX/Sxy family transcriptional regulator of competence genes
MATQPDFVEFISEQCDLGTALTYRRMFGEYAIYLDGKVVAFACDNQLYLKPTDAGRRVLKTVAEHPPFPGAKPYFRIDAEIDDRDLLRRVLLATADALPAPKPKPARRSNSRPAR